MLAVNMVKTDPFFGRKHSANNSQCWLNVQWKTFSLLAESIMQTNLYVSKKYMVNNLPCQQRVQCKHFLTSMFKKTFQTIFLMPGQNTVQTFLHDSWKHCEHIYLCQQKTQCKQIFMSGLGMTCRRQPAPTLSPHKSKKGRLGGR